LCTQDSLASSSGGAAGESCALVSSIKREQSGPPAPHEPERVVRRHARVCAEKDEPPRLTAEAAAGRSREQIEHQRMLRALRVTRTRLAARSI
jgi:hypothetical protein